MTWNNRIIKWKEAGQWHYYIHECFYEKGETVPRGWTEEGITPHGETLTELFEHHGMLGEAFKAPVLELRGEKLVEIDEKIRPRYE